MPSRAVLGLILITFVGLAGAYSAFVPLFEAPDETAHVDYVRFLRVERRLPLQGQSGEAHQPPLYYLLAALSSLPARMEGMENLLRSNPNWMWAGVGQEINVVYHTAAESLPWQGAALAIHLMRGLSVLLGAGTVLVVYLIGREISPDDDAIPLGAAAIAAFTPQFAFISGAVNNDNLANLCAAIATWMMVRVLVGHQEGWTLAGLGLALGAGLMAKQNLLVLVPVAILVLIYCSLQRRDLRLLLRGGLVILGSVAILAGWWYWRNLTLYGDLFGVGAFLAHRPQESIAAITSWADWRIFLTKMHQSFWGLFGWMNVPLPNRIYQALMGCYVLALVGGVLAAVRKRERGPSQWNVWTFLVAVPLLYTLWTITYGYRFGGSGWQGRYLFPALPAVALLLAGGLAGLLAGRGRVVPPLLMAAALLATSIWALPGIVAPSYLRVTEAPSRLAAVQNSMDVEFGNLIRLVGYDLDTTSEEGTAKVNITLYWQALDQPPADYKVFVHLVNPNWDLYGQGDGYPVRGAFPTSAWHEGDLIADSHSVQFESPPPPGQYKIALGWYLESTGERLPVLVEAGEVGTVTETALFDLGP